MSVKNIGILFETLEDAHAVECKPLELLDHWREANEIEAIRNAIENLGFKTKLLGTPEHFTKNSKNNNEIDFVFTLSVGYVTRFRQAKGAMICELLNIPYSGADPYSKILGQNKHMSKSLFNHIGIPTPDWNYIFDMDQVDEIKFPPYPLIVKPACEGTSCGIYNESLVSNRRELIRQIDYTLNEVKLPVIVEQFINGKEFKVGYIGNEERLFEGMFEDVHSDGSPLMDDFLHYDAKKSRDFAKQKRNFNHSLYSGLKNYCNIIYDLFCPIDYGIFDIRQSLEGDFYIIEFNTDASLHPERSLAQCCELNNISFDAMIEKILKSSFKRQGIEWN
jgi:D-alanine-D-alanine ligase